METLVILVVAGVVAYYVVDGYLNPQSVSGSTTNPTSVDSSLKETSSSAPDSYLSAHQNKSYIGKAFVALILYYVGFFIGGLISNILFLSQANETKRATGRSPRGRGCLIILLLVHLPLFTILLSFIFLGGLSIAAVLESIM